MLKSQGANLFLFRFGVGASAISLLGLWASLMALILSDFSGTALRFVLGFGASSTLLLAGSQSIRAAYQKSIQAFREAGDDFMDSMR